ncbi:DUF4407 domain-containing protein [Mycobacterium spongiae]|uniref:DUF4407 domain-containing protein n=1 Tax=Mycobacterium spongiae TaxID=886343 RepID=A0A975JXL6_9MYCO|nr:DUF4407 domain-containing protein [Mycobacterium spongiae]QUR67552.1 DUF4407 domain-containing protein [Mycobacterium spongiae]
MCAHEFPERRSAASRAEGVLAWLGGGHWRELGERHERSTHAVTGAVVLLGAALAWLVASLAVSESTHGPTSVPMLLIVALTLVFGLLVGAIARGTASGAARGWLGLAGRAAVAAAVGVIVGEFASLVIFSGSIDRRLDEQALHSADSTPAVAQASAALDQTREVRASLDNAVDQAREHLDQALVVARCEYHPTPACPQTRITGVPGRGPETRTANELLADARNELDNAMAARDREVPALDFKAAHDEQALAEARDAVVANAGRGLGARWVAMNDLTTGRGGDQAGSAGALMLRLLTIAFFVLLYLLPLILRLWRGETTHDRHATARAERERAELEADTAIAVKRAEVRRAAEIMWAEHQLAQTRLAIEAQVEIDREEQRRRVVEALEGPVRAVSQRAVDPVEEDVDPVEEEMYLPIAAEAEAASREVAALPAGTHDACADVAENLPAQIESEGEVEPRADRGALAIPSIPDATKAAARWMRPLVPPFVARVIDNTTAPFRSARQVFEEVEEIAFSLKRTHKVTVNSESSDAGDEPSATSPAVESPVRSNRIESSRGQASTGEHSRLDAREERRLGQVTANDVTGLSLASAGRDSRRELSKHDGPQELRSPEGPRELPPST